jgi:murein L,D-transpeptidase YafK
LNKKIKNTRQYVLKRRNIIIGAAAALALGACSKKSKFKAYKGPGVTYIIVNKKAREMLLISGNRVIKKYDIELGFSPVGDKRYEGDGKTPEGYYRINRRNPNSKFHLSLGISYPNSRDLAEARAVGKSPGGNIFIHGQSRTSKSKTDDWTWGCIAMKDSEIEEVYAMVRTGTPIKINP